MNCLNPKKEKKRRNRESEKTEGRRAGEKRKSIYKAQLHFI